MKKLFSKYWLLTLIGLTSLSNLLHAQQHLNLYNLEVIPQRMYANPAFFPSYSKVNIGLPIVPLPPVVPSLYLNMGNSGFKYSDLVRHRSDDSLYLDFDNLLSKLKKNNYISSSLQVDILTFGFAVQKNYFSFNATEKVNIRFRYPKDFMSFLINGNGSADLLGKEVAFNFGLDATHYREYGLGYARKIDDKLTIGGKFKYLYGMENINTQESDVSLTTDPTSFAITAKSNIRINTSGLDTGSFNNIGNDVGGYLFKRKNNGFGIDLGGTYLLTEKIKLSASLIDLGYIKWKDPSHLTIKSKDPNASFTYEGVDITDLFSKDTTKGDPFEKMIDSLSSTFGLDTVYETYTTRLSSQIYLGGNYYLTEKTNAGVLLYGQFFDKRIHPGLALSFSQRFGRWFNYTVSYSMYNRSFTNLGLGFGLNLGPVQWYIISDNVLGPIFPQKAKNIHLHAGVNLTFGRKQDKDKDGISDKKDKCPEVAGIKEFEGCPDKDHDHIQDSEDMCPNDSGSVELKGCPDRDNDKITDITDSCPDIAGPAEFNGCPDKDGDKIIDKDDECPEQAGSTEMKGCPDTDGDKIRDKDDACPEKAGPESNKGCPEETLNLQNAKGAVLASAVKRKDGTFLFNFMPADNMAYFKLENAEDTTKKELKIFVEDLERMVYKDEPSGLYRFKMVEASQPADADVAVKLEAAEVEVLKKAFDNLEFNSGKDVIKPSSLASLDELAELMKKKAEWRLKIAGHTDNVGNSKSNMLLSKKRAEAVKKYLVSKGIAADRFKVEAYGDTRPIADNKTPEGRQKNRRVEMIIIE